jgi:hypothetical protein
MASTILYRSSAQKLAKGLVTAFESAFKVSCGVNLDKVQKDHHLHAHGALVKQMASTILHRSSAQKLAKGLVTAFESAFKVR